MDITKFNYDLPEACIAKVPVSPRDSSRLMLLDRNNGGTTDSVFNQITGKLNKDDVLVLNDTRVIPARLLGMKNGTGAKIEVLLLRPVSEERGNVWETLVRNTRRLKEGVEIVFTDNLLKAEVLRKAEGKVLLSFNKSRGFETIIGKIGKVPLPPYIKREEKAEDRQWYQTVYSNKNGAVAAPTAGLHFTKELLDTIRDKGVRIVFITLHVGWGTFRPVRAKDITSHRMESEYYELSENSAKIINEAKKNRKRVVAVGTTSTRVLETLAEKDGSLKAGSGLTDKFIYPGYEFRVIDGLITNFHLPESTLLMLVSAFAGRQSVLKAYEYAVKHGYRFYSYGDAMFIS